MSTFAVRHQMIYFNKSETTRARNFTIYEPSICLTVRQENDVSSYFRAAGDCTIVCQFRVVFDLSLRILPISKMFTVLERVIEVLHYAADLSSVCRVVYCGQRVQDKPIACAEVALECDDDISVVHFRPPNASNGGPNWKAVT